VGRLLATADNPRGYPDVVVERAGQDTLGTSTFLARPFTGAVVYVEPSEGRRFSFYAPNVWMHGKRVLFPTFSVLGSHLSNAHQAEECARLVDAGVLAVHSPEIHACDDLAEANHAPRENRHSGTLTVRVGAKGARRLGGRGLRARRRKRAADGLRLAGGRRGRRAGAAGDQPARDPRLRRHPDAAATGGAPGATRRRPDVHAARGRAGDAARRAAPLGGPRAGAGHRRRGRAG